MATWCLSKVWRGGSAMNKITRIDIFANADAVLEFYDWAAKQPPEKKTRADMERLLGEYKKADLYVDAHPEVVEHKIFQWMKAAIIRPPKKEQK